MDPKVDGSSVLRTVTDSLLKMYTDERFAAVADIMGHAGDRPPFLFVETARNPPVARLYVVYVPNGKTLVESMADGRIQPLLRQQDGVPLFVLALRPAGASRLADPNALSLKHMAIEMYGRVSDDTATFVLPADAVNDRAMTMWIEQLTLAL